MFRFRTFNLPVGKHCYRGLMCFLRFTANHTFEFSHWEGKYRGEFLIRKLGGFQSHLTVVRPTTTGTVFRLLVLLYFYKRMTLREEGT